MNCRPTPDSSYHLVRSIPLSGCQSRHPPRTQVPHHFFSRSIFDPTSIGLPPPSPFTPAILSSSSSSPHANFISLSLARPRPRYSQGILQKSGNKFLTTRFFHQVVEKGS